MPADLAAVQADDALLDMIGGAGYSPGDDHDELTRVLAGWRQEMDAEPFSDLVDIDTALAAIRAGRRPVRRRNPVFGSIAAAAAVVVIAFSAVGLVAKSAQPGDRLWGVTQTLYGDYARSVETAAAVRTELNEARTALKQGDPERARASLQRVQKQLPAIGDTEGRTDLAARSQELEQQVVQSSGQPMEGSPTQVPSKIDGRTPSKPGQPPILTPGSWPSSWPGQPGSAPGQSAPAPESGSAPGQSAPAPESGSAPGQSGSGSDQPGSVPVQPRPTHGRPGSHGQLGPPHDWQRPPARPGLPHEQPGPPHGQPGFPEFPGPPGS
ncbi:MAG: hypothetical protein H0V41_00030 [Pseudonocardiales bacterium]|nr:hypothetical protein [Pseudonocardiales bacterium]